MPSESAMPSGFEVTSNESYMLDREVSPVNSCVFDLRGDIDHKLPEEADSTTLDEFTQSNTHEEPTRGSVEAEVPTMDAIQRNSTTGTSSAMPLREVGGNTEVGNETSLGTRNAKRLKAGQNFDDSEVVDLDFFEGPSDSSETEDTPPASSGKKRPRKSQKGRGPNKSEKEKRYFYQFLESRVQKNIGWGRITEEYNREFGTSHPSDRLKRYRGRERRRRTKEGIPVCTHSITCDDTWICSAPLTIKLQLFPIQAQGTEGVFGPLHADPQHRLNRIDSDQSHVVELIDSREAAMQ
jgi:hypothetical protein